MPLLHPIEAGRQAVTVTANGHVSLPIHDIDPIFLHRWSPRAFTGEPIPHAVLMSLFEAARWAPSAFNIQPWRFVYAKRDTPDWERLLGVLIEYNQAWVREASALVFVVSDRFRHKADAAPEPLYSHSASTPARPGPIWPFRRITWAGRRTA